MTTIDVCSVSVENESAAVAIGQAILRAELPVRLSEDIWTLGEDQYSELEQFLGRRGIALRANDNSDIIADRA